MTNLRGDKDRETRHTVVSEPEMQQLLTMANLEENEFLRLRNRAILCVLRKTGKSHTSTQLRVYDGYYLGCPKCAAEENA